MSRCEGYYRLENRRCDREASTSTRVAHGERYELCEYHRRHAGPVARWHGEGDRRLPSHLRLAAGAAA